MKTLIDGVIHIADMSQKYTICRLPVGEKVGKRQKATCPVCIERARMPPKNHKRWKREIHSRPIDPDADIDPLGIADDDAPDGAYFAMIEEFYGW